MAQSSSNSSHSPSPSFTLGSTSLHSSSQEFHQPPHSIKISWPSVLPPRLSLLGRKTISLRSDHTHHFTHLQPPSPPDLVLLPHLNHQHHYQQSKDEALDSPCDGLTSTQPFNQTFPFPPPSLLMTHSIHHTRQLSSSAGIGESPINPITYSNYQPTSSILNTLRRVHSRTRIRSRSHATQPDTDQRPITVFRFPLPPSHAYSSASLPDPSLPLTQAHQLHDKRPERDESGAYSFVASLGRAPISSAIPASPCNSLPVQVQPPSQPSFNTEPESWLNLSNPRRPTHSISSAPALLPRTGPAPNSHLVNLPHSRPKLLSSTSASNSFQIHPTSEHVPTGTFSNIQPSLLPPKHARFQQSSDGHLPSLQDPQPEPKTTSTDNLAFVRLRVMSFETVGGLCGKYTDPRPRFYGTTLSRPASIVAKRPASFDEEILAISDSRPPRKRSESFVDIRRHCAAVEAERSHAQRVWDDMYRSIREREQWRDEVEASCFYPSRSSAEHQKSRNKQASHPRRRPSLVVHRPNDVGSSCNPLVPSSSCLHGTIPDQQRPKTTQPPSTPHGRRRAQTVVTRSSRRPSREHERGPIPAPISSRAAEDDDLATPTVGRSFDLLYPFLSQPSRHRRTNSNTVTRETPKRSTEQPETPASSERGYRIIIPGSQDRSRFDRPRTADTTRRRSSSVPGMRHRHHTNSIAQSHTQPISIHTTPQIRLANERLPDQPHRQPSIEFGGSLSPARPRSEERPDKMYDLLQPQLGPQSTLFSRAGLFQADSFQSLFHRSRTLRSKVTTGQVTGDPKEISSLASTFFDRPVKSQGDSTGPLLQAFSRGSPPQFSSQVDSLCDPALAHLVHTDNSQRISCVAEVVSGTSEDMDHHRVSESTSCRRLLGKDVRRLESPTSPSEYSENAENEGSKGPLYSLPLYIPPRTAAISPLPPPPRKRNSPASNPSIGPSRSRSRGSLKSGYTPEPLAEAPSVARDRAFVSFLNVPLSAIPTSSIPPHSSHSTPSPAHSTPTPPHTPIRTTHTTATNPAQPHPIILHNLPSAVATLERIRRLSSPDPLLPTFGFKSGSGSSNSCRPRESVGFVRSASGGDDAGYAPRPSSASERSGPISPSTHEAPTLEGSIETATNPKESLDSERVPITPDLTRPPGSPLPRERGRKSGRRQRTLTELSESSNRSESSHSVIDLDKYIDQADLFYQAPTSPRRDLIKRYSEQMTDERIASASVKANARERRRINQSNLSPNRKSRLIDEVLTDYFNLSQKQSEQEDVVVRREESEDVEDLVHQVEGIGEGSGTTDLHEVSSNSRKLESNVGIGQNSRASSRSSKISLVPSIVDIYEARSLSRSRVISSSDTSTLTGPKAE